MNYRILFLFVIALLSLSACSLIKPVSNDINISLTTNTQLNPDTEGRSSPVVLRIYELTSDSLFKNSDFFDIYDDDKTTLADTFVKKQELELNPNESRKLSIKPDSKTRFIAVIAAFRNLDDSKWQELIKLEIHKPTGIPVHEQHDIDIRLDKNRITLVKK